MVSRRKSLYTAALAAGLAGAIALFYARRPEEPAPQSMAAAMNFAVPAAGPPGDGPYREPDWGKGGFWLDSPGELKARELALMDAAELDALLSEEPSLIYAGYEDGWSPPPPGGRVAPLLPLR